MATMHVATAADAKEYCFYADQRELSHLGFSAPGWMGKDGKKLKTNLMIMFNMPISEKFRQLYHGSCICSGPAPKYRTARIYMPAGLFHNVRSGYVQKLKSQAMREQNPDTNDGGLHSAMAHYLHRYCYDYVESKPGDVDENTTVVSPAGELLHAMGLCGILPMAMAQVVSKENQMGKSFTYTEMFKWHALGIKPNANYSDFGCKASVWMVDESGEPLEEIEDILGKPSVNLSTHHYFRDEKGEPSWDPKIFTRTELIPCSHQMQDLTARFSSFAFTRELADGAVLYRAQQPGCFSVLYQTNGNVSFLEWDSGEVLTTLTGPDIVDVHVHARNYQSICQALSTRVAKAEEAKNKRQSEGKRLVSNSEKSLMKRFVQQIADIAFQRSNLIAWREKNPLCELLKSPNMDAKTFRSEVEKMWGTKVLSYIDNYTAQIKVEVNPSNPEKRNKGEPAPEDKPRIYISVKEQAIIASLLVIKCFEDIWFGYDPSSKHDVKFDQELWGAQKVIYRSTAVEFNMPDHIKHIRRETALKEHIERSRKNRLPRACFGAEGDGSSWDWTISHEIREHTENIILDKIVRVLTELWCFDVPVEAIQTQMKDRKAKTAKMKVNTKDREEKSRYYVWANNKESHDIFVKKSVSLVADTVRWSGERGTSSLNHFVNHVFWSYVLFRNPIEAYLRPTQDGWMEFNCRDSNGNPAHESRARTLWIRQAKGIEGDDSSLTLEVAVADTPSNYVYKIDALHGQNNGGVVHQPGRHTNEGLRLLDPTDAKDWELIERFFRKVKDLWEAWGFMMKIILIRPGESTVFIGANFLMTKEGLGMCYVPEILRGIASASWSVSREILTHGLNSKRGATAAYASFCARAVGMPNVGTATIVREYFIACSQAYVLANHKHGVAGMTEYKCDRDIARKFGVDPGTAINIYAEVERSRQYYSWMIPEDVDRLVAITCGKVTEKEWISGTSWGPLSRDSIGVLDRFPKTWQEKIRKVDHLYEWEPEGS